MRALIDTGSTDTVIDFSLVEKLELIKTGSREFYRPGHEPSTQPTYHANISLAVDRDEHGKNIIGDFQLRVIGTTIDSDVKMLIGRDLLTFARFTYHGPNFEYRIQWVDQAERNRLSRMIQRGL